MEEVHRAPRELGAAGYPYQPYSPSMLAAAPEASVRGGVYYPPGRVLGPGHAVIMGLGDFGSRLRKPLRIPG
jgi:hypothetical protein